jgi:hypothetical protein
MFDNMSMRLTSPWEDETGICNATARSPMMGSVFPRDDAHFRRYLSLDGVAGPELELWLVAWRRFLSKLTWKYRKRLLLKSPAHTARIRVLLHEFPSARFIHIHREPYTVFQSTRHMMTAFGRTMRLQAARSEELEESILATYADMYEHYFRDRHGLGEGQLVELSFEDLEQRPLWALRGVYRQLGLGDFGRIEEPVRTYLATQDGYQKNRYGSLEEPWKSRVARRWKRSFDAWGYAT